MSPLADEDTDLSVLLGAGADFWAEHAPSFVDRYDRLGFQWSSSSSEYARARHPHLQFAGLPVLEALVDFEESRPTRMTLLVYSRGDTGDLSRSRFDRLLKRVDETFTAWCGSGPTVIQTPHERSTRHQIRRSAWVRPPHRLDLACGFSSPTGPRSFRAEFVKLVVTPFDPDDDPRTRPILMKPQHGVISGFALRERIERTSKGDVFISGIPMVDQGEKGYCAVATGERLLRYFQREIDQHELAQIADSSAQWGTNPETMIRVLRSICGKMGLKVRVLEELDGEDFLRIVKDYNRSARKQDLEPVAVGGVFIVVSQLYDEMNSDVLFAVRTKNKSALRRFRKTVKKHVDGGVPLAWSVILGKFAEKPVLRQSGGHMRLILGYNQGTDELLYSDSWGPGHEIKRLPFDQAWTVTTGLYTVTPDNIRL